MKKIISVWKRDYEDTRLIYDEVVEGAEWVLAGEGIATVKFDGTACQVQDGQLWKRYDRKRNKKTGEHKPAPEGWEPCEDEPNEQTGHWPGWLVIGPGPEDKWHREAWERETADTVLEPGTYELVGPKVQGNPYNLMGHELWRHGMTTFPEEVGRSFDEIRTALEIGCIEGMVWYHPDGRMAKIKRRDFGFPWPVQEVKRKAAKKEQGS